MNTAHNRLSHADRIQGAIKSLCELGIAIRPVYIYYPHDMFNPTAVICSFSFLFFNFFSYLYIIEGSVARRVDARNLTPMKLLHWMPPPSELQLSLNTNFK